MNNLPSTDNSASLKDLSQNTLYQKHRMLKDVIAHRVVGFGGIGVIIAIVLIFFYLLMVVVPLFESADAKAVADYQLPGIENGDTLYLAMEEQAEVGSRFTQDGHVVFFSTLDGHILKNERLPIPPGVTITSFAAGDPLDAYVVLGLSNGYALVVHHVYDVTFPDDKRLISPRLEYPLGQYPVVIDRERHALSGIAVQGNEEKTVVVATTDDHRLLLSAFTREESLLDDNGSVSQEIIALTGEKKELTHFLIDKDQRIVYASTQDGQLESFNISEINEPVLIQRLRITGQDITINELKFLTGTISIIAADSKGIISQWFPVRDENNNELLRHIRDFSHTDSTVTKIAPEYGRKGFLVADKDGRMTIYHATAHQKLLTAQVSSSALTRLAVSPRANAFLAESDDGKLHFWQIDNEYPEISWTSLWGKVWYESHSEPEYLWQSSSASNDFEPKLSLIPISFGTIKAAFYAMLFAAPLAILGAIFTAYFMTPRMRSAVKPSIEIMEALPTVILGFLAGLWLAPYIEVHLPGIFTLLVLLPVGIMLSAYIWMKMPSTIRHSVPEGWEAALLIPVVIFITWFSMTISPVIETSFFGGDVRKWLTNEMGIGFDQRNSLVVGLAMGFAVIPTIFSIAEDAIFGVPRHLTQGSLALGATPWQTMWRVVLLTASPGIFSALMIGFGRAVGETMIVLMATGNTPVMDFSIFSGMRTLSANIAVEMPEAEVASTHYRVLFLAALVLFMFTFVFNTFAEIIRQRLRGKYSSL